MDADLVLESRFRLEIESPRGKEKRKQVSIRYHREVVEYFKSTGGGWQTRMDEALMEWVKTHSHSA